jgi:CRISPR-associated protein Cas2
MHVLLVYDLEDTQKIHKICKIYLNWVQNSVFEGEITDSKLKQLKLKIKQFVKNYDSVLIYKIKDKKLFIKETIGNEKNKLSNFI